MKLSWTTEWRILFFKTIIIYGYFIHAVQQISASNPDSSSQEMLKLENNTESGENLLTIDKNQKQFSGLDAPRNLTGFVFWDETVNIFRMELTWQPPEDTENMYGYNLTYFCEPGPCKSGFHKKADLLFKESTSVIIPKINENDIDSQLEDFISLNSTIHVILQSLPFNRFRNNSAVLIYQVPECIDDRCYCGHMNFLPKPIVMSTIRSNGEVNVSWTIPYKILQNNDSRYHTIHVYIELYRQLELIYNYTVTLQSEEINSERHTTLPSEFPVTDDYNLVLHFRDDDGCTSSNATTVVAVIEAENFLIYIRNTFYIIIVLITIFVMLIILIIGRQRAKKFLKYICGKSVDGSEKGIELAAISNEGYLKLTKLSNTTIPLKTSAVYFERSIFIQQNNEKDIDPLEIDYNRLEFMNTPIGHGEFGLVFRAYLTAVKNNDKCMVAVKTLKNYPMPDEINEFIKEIKMFRQVGEHPNIVKLLGYCTKHEPFCMVMEYLANGDLAMYLRKLKDDIKLAQTKFSLQCINNENDTVFNFSRTDLDQIKIYTAGSVTSITTTDSSLIMSGRPSTTETEYILLSSESSPMTPVSAIETPPAFESILNIKELQKFALQIAQGMAHLEQKNVTHRDLAARNILIDDQGNLKISDFGLSRAGTYVCTKSKLPFRWLSIESLREQIFTNKSDVWSYGIVLWEIGTLGDIPYSDMENYIQILNFLMDGQRLEKPNTLTENIYKLMLRCWAELPEDRPTFADLVTILQPMNQEKKTYITFDNIKSDYIAHEQWKFRKKIITP